jgi:hypothetical protein
LEISSYGFEADQSALNLQVSIFDAAGMEIYGLDMDFTADEYGMFSYSDESQTFEDGEYTMAVSVTDLTNGSLLFNDNDMTLYVYNGGGPSEVGMDVWSYGNYQSGVDVVVDVSAWGLEGDNYEMIWDCNDEGMTFIMESALQGDTSVENIQSMMDNLVMPEWCNSIVDEALIVNGSGGDMFQGETVWVSWFGMVMSYEYDLDLNLTMVIHETDRDTVAEMCEDNGFNDDGEATYDPVEDTCTMKVTFIVFDVGDEYIWEEEAKEIQFVCGNGEGIPFDFVNDGDEDCDDGSDEPQDFDGDGVTDNWFDCHDESTVSMDLVNDGNDDCAGGEDEGGDSDETVGYHMRYSNDGESLWMAEMEEEYEQLYDAYIQLFDENGWVMDISVNENDYDISLGQLEDGYYGVGGIIVDENGDEVWSSAEISNFCVGPNCGGPVWETGDAILNLTLTWEEYDSVECNEKVTIMLFHLEDLQNNMGGDGNHEDGGDNMSAEEIMEMVDSDGDGYLSLQEIIDHINEEESKDNGTNMSQEEEDNLSDMFTESDSDGDGLLNLDEVEHLSELMDEADGGDGDHEEGDNGQGDGGEHNKPQPVWADSLEFNAGQWELYGLPDGDWVVIATMDCTDDEDGEKYRGHGASGGLFAMDELEFANGSVTYLDLTMQTMTEDNGNGPGDGDGDLFKDAETGNLDFQIMVEDSPDGILLITKQETELSDFIRGLVDDEFGDGDGIVTETEAMAAMEYFDLMMSMSEEGDGGDGPEFAWNGVTVTEQDIQSEDMTIEGLVGSVPSSLAEDTASVSMVMRTTYLLADNGEDTQVLSPSEGDGDHDNSNNSSEDCKFLSVAIADSETWNVESITDGGNVYTYDEGSSTWNFDYGCNEEPTDEISISFSRVSEEPEPEPVVNTPPTCDVYWYGSDDSLADGKEGGHEADEGTETGDFSIELTEGATYTLMFYCMDAEGDELTVTVDPSIGDTKTMTGNGSLSGYYEFMIPTGTSALGEMSFDYDRTAGTISDDGTVTVNVLEGTGGADDETAADDVSAGSFVPGFTAVLTMTALAGAFLVFSRREEE